MFLRKASPAAYDHMIRTPQIRAQNLGVINNEYCTQRRTEHRMFFSFIEGYAGKPVADACWFADGVRIYVLVRVLEVCCMICARCHCCMPHVALLSGSAVLRALWILLTAVNTAKYCFAAPYEKPCTYLRVCVPRRMSYCFHRRKQ